MDDTARENDERIDTSDEQYLIALAKQDRETVASVERSPRDIEAVRSVVQEESDDYLGRKRRGRTKP